MTAAGAASKAAEPSAETKAARTRTIRSWTGLTDDRIRKLYRSYVADGSRLVDFVGSTPAGDMALGALRGLREVLLPTGWVDVKVCAVDADWSGLKFLRRRR